MSELLQPNEAWVWDRDPPVRTREEVLAELPKGYGRPTTLYLTRETFSALQRWSEREFRGRQEGRNMPCDPVRRRFWSVRWYVKQLADLSARPSPRSFCLRSVCKA